MVHGPRYTCDFPNGKWKNMLKPDGQAQIVAKCGPVVALWMMRPTSET